jgi:hypothetical protein
LKSECQPYQTKEHNEATGHTASTPLEILANTNAYATAKSLKTDREPAAEFEFIDELIGMMGLWLGLARSDVDVQYRYGKKEGKKREKERKDERNCCEFQIVSLLDDKRKGREVNGTVVRLKLFYIAHVPEEQFG